MPMTSPTKYVRIPTETRSCVVFASPSFGSGLCCVFPACGPRFWMNIAIRSSEDAFVDLLFDCCAAAFRGSRFIKAGAPRAYPRPQPRARDELGPIGHRRDPAAGVITRAWPRGLGVIPRVSWPMVGRFISGKLSTRGGAGCASTATGVPYHAKCCRSLLSGAHRRSRAGGAWSIATPCRMRRWMASRVCGMRRPDVVLGDRFGAAAGGEVVDRIEAAFRRGGVHW